MKIELSSTSQIVRIDGVECRVWEGKTGGGIAVTAFVARVAVDVEADASQFQAELRAVPEPRPANVWPSRLFFDFED